MRRPDLDREAVGASKGRRVSGRSRGAVWGDRGIRIFAVILATITAILLTTIRVMPASDAAVGDSGITVGTPGPDSGVPTEFQAQGGGGIIFGTPGTDPGREFTVSASVSTPTPTTYKGVSGYSIVVKVEIGTSGWFNTSDTRNSLVSPITFRDDLSGLPPGTKLQSCTVPPEPNMLPDPRAFCMSATSGSSISPTPSIFVELRGIRHITGSHRKRIVLFVPYSTSLHEKTWVNKIAGVTATLGLQGQVRLRKSSCGETPNTNVNLASSYITFPPPTPTPTPTPVAPPRVVPPPVVSNASASSSAGADSRANAAAVAAANGNRTSSASASATANAVAASRVASMASSSAQASASSTSSAVGSAVAAANANYTSSTNAAGSTAGTATAVAASRAAAVASSSADASASSVANASASSSAGADSRVNAAAVAAAGGGGPSTAAAAAPPA